MQFRSLFFVCLLCLRSVAGAPYVGARQDVSPSEPASDEEPVPTESSVAASRESATPFTRASAFETPSTKVTSTSATSVGAASNAAQPSNTGSHEKAEQNPLPIHPRITPAMGLSGVIMLISGVVYAVIGIKNKLYVFSSAAYLTSLAVTVLIIYLMNPPVSDAVQGGFFVAAFLSGFIFGALALVFIDITEGLGCLLGGFCLSMWFLTVKEGGLIESITGRAIFIGCMSAAAYSLSFSRLRTYGLIISISFAGATITTLGIDCLSRAGWKEFWLYIWNLNTNTFPLNTNTYPMTRAIKVELACVVLICVFGIISQLRLWRLVKERRERSHNQRLEREQNKEREEEELGRRIEDSFARERAEWEATYGTRSKSSGESTVTTNEFSLRKNTPKSNSAEVLAKGGVTQSASTAKTTVTVAVLPDDEIEQIDADGNSAGTHGPEQFELQAPSQSDAQPLATSSVPPPPVVVPLPFKIPNEADMESQEGDNASVSAVPESVHESISNQIFLLQMSGMKRASTSRIAAENPEKGLIISNVEEDRASSIAATLDEADDTISLPQLSSRPYSLVEAADPDKSQNNEQENAHVSNTEREAKADTSKRNSADDNYRKDNANAENLTADRTHQQPMTTPDPNTVRQPLTVSTDPRSDAGVGANSPRQRADTVVSSAKAETSNLSGASSTNSRTDQAESQVGGLQDALPDKLSKVALSYRTNEWAKHLEAAEKPSLDNLSEPESPVAKEQPAPISDELAEPLLANRSKRVSSGSKAREGVIRSTSNLSRTSLSPMPAMLRSDSKGNKINRSSSTPFLSPGTLSPPSPAANNTLIGQRDELVRNRVTSQSFTPQSSSPNLVGAPADHEDIPLAQRKRMLQHSKPPSAAQKWRQSGVAKPAQGFDSHQPKRQSGSGSGSGSDQRRQALLAGWRESIRQDVAPVQTMGIGEEQRRVALMNEKCRQEMQQQAMMAQQRESKMDAMMRSGEFLDAHREAMRRMQANANKRV